MEARADMKRSNSHTPEELDWMKRLIEQHGKVKAKIIRDHGLTDEYHNLFNKTLTVAGMYSWGMYIQDPGLKKRYYYNKKAKGDSRPTTERKELEVFKKSQYIAYINRRLCGFEDREQLEKFMKENKVLSEDVKLFKLLPVKVEYSVEIGN